MKMHTVFKPKVRDRDDDKEVEWYSQQSDGWQQNVKKEGLDSMLHRPPAGHVEQLWKAEITSFEGVHQRKRQIMNDHGCVASLNTVFSCSPLPLYLKCTLPLVPLGTVVSNEAVLMSWSPLCLSLFVFLSSTSLPSVATPHSDKSHLHSVSLISHTCNQFSSSRSVFAPQFHTLPDGSLCSHARLSGVLWWHSNLNQRIFFFFFLENPPDSLVFFSDFQSSFMEITRSPHIKTHQWPEEADVYTTSGYTKVGITRFGNLSCLMKRTRRC